MNTRSLILTCMVCAVAGCGDRPADPEAGVNGTGVTAATRPTTEAVTAVQQSEGEPVARVSFVIGTKPVVGKAFPMQLSITAAEALPTLHVLVEGTHLIVTPPTTTLAIAAAGTPVTHELVVTAQQAGWAELTLRLKTEPASPETVYQIPVLVAAAG